MGKHEMYVATQQHSPHNSTRSLTSSSSIDSSSNSIYLEKSFFNTLIKIIVKNAVKSNTNTNELIMLSQ
jgi:predicted DNA-binding ribbon-helix-helix protein